MSLYPKCSHLEWDSDFFGYNIYKVNGWLGEEKLITEILQDLRDKGARLVYWYAKQEMKFPLFYHFLLADIKLDYSKALAGDIIIDENIISYPANEHSDKLMLLALASGEYSRYKIDIEFKNGEFEKLYREWLLKSIQRDIADDVLVYTQQDDIFGFVTFAFQPLNKLARIGLIAVDEKYRGKKIGKKLIDAVLQKANAKGYRDLNVFTQEANKQACAFYEKWGFTKADRDFIYHIWLPNSER